MRPTTNRPAPAGRTTVAARAGAAAALIAGLMATAVALLVMSAGCGDGAVQTDTQEETGVSTIDKVVRTDEEWKSILPPERYEVLREKGTERAFTGEYDDFWEDGVYVCYACEQPLFDSSTKFHSGSGWPSFWRPIAPEAVEEHEDASHGMLRVEVTCARCGGHLGHVFTDGPEPTGLRYCINSLALKFIPR